MMENAMFDKINKMKLPFIDRYEVINGVRVLRFKGSIDAETIPVILKLKDVIVKDQDIDDMNVLVDLEKVEYADSAALAALIIRVSELKRRNKKLGLIKLPDRLIHVLEIFRCDELFLMFDSEEEALNKLNSI